MHDPVIGGVGEGRQHALEHPGDLGQAERAHVGAQRAALEVLHRDVGHPLVLEVLVDGDDVGVPERAGDARLLQEAGGGGRIGGVEGRQLLEGDVAQEVGLAGQVDHRHPAAADLAHDLEAPDALSLARHLGLPPGATGRARVRPAPAHAWTVVCPAKTTETVPGGTPSVMPLSESR